MNEKELKLFTIACKHKLNWKNPQKGIDFDIACINAVKDVAEESGIILTRQESVQVLRSLKS